MSRLISIRTMSALDFSDSCRTHHASVDLARDRGLSPQGRALQGYSRPRPAATDRTRRQAYAACALHGQGIEQRAAVPTGSRIRRRPRTDQARCCLRRSWADPVPRPTRRRLDSGRGHTARGRGFDACCKSPAPGWTDAGGRAPGLRREEAPCQGRVCTEGTYEVGLPGGDRAASSDQERNKAGCRPPPSDRSQGTGDADGERHSRDIRGSCQALIAASRVRDADSSRGPALERCGHPRQPARSRDCGPRSHHYHDRKGRSDAHPARAPRGVVARRREGAVAGRV